MAPARPGDRDNPGAPRPGGRRGRASCRRPVAAQAGRARAGTGQPDAALLSNVRYLTTFSAGQRRTEALTKIGDFQDIWHVSLILFGLHLILIGYLAVKSGYVPRVLGVLLVIAGAGYLVGSSGALLVPGNSVNVAAFTFIGEALFMLWLLAKGRNVTPKA